MSKSRIYTRTGDAGDTALFGGERVPKSHARVQAYGEVDELNACIGSAMSQLNDDADIRARLFEIQQDLFVFGSHLAMTPTPRGRAPALPPLPSNRAVDFEHWIDDCDCELPELRAFILPGGTRGASALHVARTVCRRAERAVVALSQQDNVDPLILVYLNRLSDLLFAWARLANHRAGVEEIIWQPKE